MLLATALANARDHRGQRQRCRILCDPGSQVSFISRACAARLGLRTVHTRVPVEGIGAATVMTSGCMRVPLQSLYNAVDMVTAEVHILDSISPDMPFLNTDRGAWTHLNGLQLSDPEFNRTGSIDLLLGADVWGMVVRQGIVKGAPPRAICPGYLFWMCSVRPNNEEEWCEPWECSCQSCNVL